jgi:hypothetical protein
MVTVVDRFAARVRGLTLSLLIVAVSDKTTFIVRGKRRDIAGARLSVTASGRGCTPTTFFVGVNVSNASIWRNTLVIRDNVGVNVSPAASVRGYVLPP